MPLSLITDEGVSKLLHLEVTLWNISGQPGQRQPNGLDPYLDTSHGPSWRCNVDDQTSAPSPSLPCQWTSEGH